jgi:CSLREA domain-containing protein/uncharacterized repeat protein (TIGR01451 family)
MAVTLAGVVAALVVAPATPGFAAEFTVTRLDDPAPGGCAAGDCSLREAVIAANASPGPDVIRLPPGTVKLTRTGVNTATATEGDLDITGPLTILGPTGPTRTSTIDGGQLEDRIFDVAGASLALSDVVVYGGGTLAGGTAIDRGGGVRMTGDGAALTATRVLFTAHQAVSGGAIAVLGTAGSTGRTITLFDTEIADNQVSVDGAGIHVDNPGELTLNVSGGAFQRNVAGRDGGALWVNFAFPVADIDGLLVEDNTADRAAGLGFGGIGQATIRNSTFQGNQALDAANGYGGGLWAHSTNITIESSTFAENTVARDGGAVFVRYGSLDVATTWFVGNAADAGGAIGAETLEEVVITTSTIEDNDARDGAGIYNLGDGRVTLRNTTVSGNRATNGTGGVRAPQVRLEHATVASNTGTPSAAANVHVTASAQFVGAIVADPRGGAPNCRVSGATVSGTATVESATTCGLAAAGNRLGVDPGLAALADNGGPTRTRALLATSPAIDLRPTPCPPTDQRGQTRPVDGDGDGTPACDAGAYEFVPQADLGTSLLDGPDPVRVGETLTYVVVVGNAGPQSARDVEINLDLPDAVILDAASLPDGCTVVTDGTRCALGTMAAGAEAERRITVEPDEVGTLTATAVATSATADPTPANAHATTTTTVLDRGAVQPARLAGADRFATAVAISEATFDPGTAKAVVLARADLFPDALAGTPLAVRLGGPLLLTASDQLPALVADELQRVLPAGATVVLLGGTSAISPAVATAIESGGWTVRRLGGADRYATAVAIARDGLGDPDVILVADGTNFPDALTAGTAAAALDGAVLLSARDAAPAATAAHLAERPRQVTAVGGPAARAFPEATPIVGATRYETALGVAEAFFPAPRAIGIGTGQAFPDALAGGVHVARLGGPILLSPPDALPDAVADYLRRIRGSLRSAHLYGGERALTVPVADAVTDALALD